MTSLAEGRPGARQPILVVDDEPENLALLERFLRRRYAPIYLASDGAQGLEVLQRHRLLIDVLGRTEDRVQGLAETLGAKDRGLAIALCEDAIVRSGIAKGLPVIDLRDV